VNQNTEVRIDMQLVIRRKESYLLEFVGSESISELKIRVPESERCDDVLLYVAGRLLDFEAEGLSVAALENLAVDVTVPLMGGKVHGSLARADKVRGQIPKVAALEKPCS
jgi:small subunit ribosomal protein S30e